MFGSLALSVATGVAFGTIYALTHDLWLVALLHGVGNFRPLVVDPGTGAWPNWGVVVVPYGPVVPAYRRWAAGVPGTTRSVSGAGSRTE